MVVVCIPLLGGFAMAHRAEESCISCTDKRTPCMKRKGKMCETTALLDTHCHQSDYWSKNKFCQLSCFKAENGYDGDECCDNPVTCISCTDEVTPWMFREGKMCETNALIDTHCDQSKYWSMNKFCQLSCFKPDNGYDGDECCENSVTCNICTDEETPWMKKHDKKCESTEWIKTKCHQSNYWEHNNFCQLSCLKANKGYEWG